MRIFTCIQTHIYIYIYIHIHTYIYLYLYIYELVGNSPKIDGHAATRRVRLSALRQNNEKLAKVDVFVPESSTCAFLLLFAWTTSLQTALPHEVGRCGRALAHAR